MSLDFIQSEDSVVKIVVSKDKAIGPDSDFQKYLETLDESHLKLVGEPTRFVMKKRLKFRQSQALKQQQMNMSADGKPNINIAFYMEEVRLRLVGVDQPADAPHPITWKKDGDGGAHVEIMEWLEEIGAIDELYAAFLVSVKQTQEDLKKK